MKIREFSELQLAAVIAVATLIGGLLNPLIGAVFIDAGTNKQSNVQLVELAINILSEPLGQSQTDEELAANTALRDWAVDTINAAAPVRFNSVAKQSLVRGKAQLLRQTLVVNGTEIEASPQTLNYLVRRLQMDARRYPGRMRVPRVERVQPRGESAPDNEP